MINHAQFFLQYILTYPDDIIRSNVAKYCSLFVFPSSHRVTNRILEENSRTVEAYVLYETRFIRLFYLPNILQTFDREFEACFR